MDDTVHALKPRNEETYCGRDARVSGGGIPYGFGIRGVTCEPCVEAAMATEPARDLLMYTRYFSFGCGQTDPETGENLIDKYVTVIAPTPEGCREAMLGSRFGREWSMEYIPGRPRTDEWISQWTEHARIVVDADGGCE